MIKRKKIKGRMEGRKKGKEGRREKGSMIGRWVVEIAR